MPMKIIEQGDREKAKQIRLDICRFRCRNCNCVWEAGNDEYTYGTQREPGPYMTCPCCGKKYVEGTRLYI